jgi:hypothetical protein
MEQMLHLHNSYGHQCCYAENAYAICLISDGYAQRLGRNLMEVAWRQGLRHLCWQLLGDEAWLT